MQSMNCYILLGLPISVCCAALSGEGVPAAPRGDYDVVVYGGTAGWAEF